MDPTTLVQLRQRELHAEADRRRLAHLASLARRCCDAAERSLFARLVRHRARAGQPAAC
jgi:hypothetical protein